jgi:hypothetical protein
MSRIVIIALAILVIFVIIKLPSLNVLVICLTVLGTVFRI